MLPFASRQAWQGVFVGLLAFPVLLASAVLRIVGQRSRAASLDDWIRRAWLDLASGRLVPAPWWKRWAALGISLAVFAITLYLLIGIVINLGYPLRPDNEPTDWGGPSLVGRWAVHGAGGVLFAVVTPLICGRLAALVRRLLEDAESGNRVALQPKHRP